MAPTKPSSSASMVKAKSVCFSGRKLSWAWLPCRNPLPQRPPEPERDLGLDDVVAGPQRIGLRVEEGEHALALIVVEIGPQDRQRRGTQHADGHELPQAHAGHEQERRAADQERHRCAEIGLHQHQPARHQDQQQRRHQDGQPPQVLGIGGVKVAGQRHDQRHLHQLRRLELDDAEIEPALGALVDLAQHVDRDQHGQDRAIEG